MDNSIVEISASSLQALYNASGCCCSDFCSSTDCRNCNIYKAQQEAITLLEIEKEITNDM